MQAWGLQSRFSMRDTAREPTKSGVIGLICAALGRDRKEDIHDLASLRMGVRVDREGQIRHDFHTAKDILKASAPLARLQKGQGGPTKDTEPSTRYYLADAWFTVGLESQNKTLLEEIEQALGNPTWPLFLGRKSFPPGLPIQIVNHQNESVGLHERRLVKALTEFEDPCWSLFVHRQRNERNMGRFVVEAGSNLGALNPIARRMQPDQPLSFSPRRYLPREVIVGYLPIEEHDASN
jgi:CRISPR system Cascade subunit CasD